MCVPPPPPLPWADVIPAPCVLAQLTRIPLSRPREFVSARHVNLSLDSLIDTVSRGSLFLQRTSRFPRSMDYTRSCAVLPVYEYFGFIGQLGSPIFFFFFFLPFFSPPTPSDTASPLKFLKFVRVVKRNAFTETRGVENVDEG